MKYDPWQNTKREPDVFDAIRGMDNDPLVARAEEVTGNLILVKSGDPLWSKLDKAIRSGDINKAINIRNKMIRKGSLTITPRFSNA